MTATANVPTANIAVTCNAPTVTNGRVANVPTANIAVACNAPTTVSATAITGYIEFTSQGYAWAAAYAVLASFTATIGIAGRPDRISVRIKIFASKAAFDAGLKPDGLRSVTFDLASISKETGITTAILLRLIQETAYSACTLA